MLDLGNFHVYTCVKFTMCLYPSLPFQPSKVAHNHTEPLLFMGALAIVCGVCVWKLPEARGQTPYNTLEEPMFSH